MNASQKWRVAAVALIGPALALMDNTIVSVILPQLQQTFQTDFPTITWIASVYFLAEAAVTPMVGYLGDRFGSKRAYLIALALFTASSLLCALAPTKEALIAFRVLQGIGGGALIPMYYAISYRIFTPAERSKLTAVVSIPLLIAPAFAPTIGGYLSTSFNWNAVFIMNVPFGIVALLLCFLILPGRTSDQSEQKKRPWKSFDFPGLLLSLVGVSSLVYGISEASSKGWSETTVLTALLIGAAALIAFTVVELRVSDPVLDLRLFKSSTFTLSNILVWFNVAVFTGGQFLLPLFFENVQGNTALIAGSLLIGQGVATAVGMSISGILYNRLGPRPLAVFGLLLMVSGTYGLTQINANTTGEALQVWLLLRGLSLGFIYQPAQTLALSVVSNKGMARASSLTNVTRQVAIATAVAALSTYQTAQTATYGVGQQAIAAGIADTFWLLLILTAVCIPLALFMGRDPAIEALKKAQQAKGSDVVVIEQVQEDRHKGQAQGTAPTVTIGSIPNMISTLTANGEEIMGPEILLWRYPEDNIVSGSLLTVKSNHFCVLKSYGTILNVYEAGQYIVHTPDSHLHCPMQLAFSGEPIPWQYEALYINRAMLVVKASGVALSREMAEVDYTVDYSIQVATCEDAFQLVKHMPCRGHTHNIREINAYAEPVIKQAVSQLVQVVFLGQQAQELSQQVYQRLQQCLSIYGITVSLVNVLVGPRDKHTTERSATQTVHNPVESRLQRPTLLHRDYPTILGR